MKTFNLTYEILDKPYRPSPKAKNPSKISLEAIEDDLENDEDLLQILTEIFSIILLKKRKKHLKLKHHDKEARLPHPSSLMTKRKPADNTGSRKR